jgi:hypothetical protein
MEQVSPTELRDLKEYLKLFVSGVAGNSISPEEVQLFRLNSNERGTLSFEIGVSNLPNQAIKNLWEFLRPQLREGGVEVTRNEKGNFEIKGTAESLTSNTTPEVLMALTKKKKLSPQQLKALAATVQKDTLSLSAIEQAYKAYQKASPENKPAAGEKLIQLLKEIEGPEKAEAFRQSVIKEPKNENKEVLVESHVNSVANDLRKEIHDAQKEIDAANQALNEKPDTLAHVNPPSNTRQASEAQNMAKEVKQTVDLITAALGEFILNKAGNKEPFKSQGLNPTTKAKIEQYVQRIIEDKSLQDAKKYFSPITAQYLQSKNSSLKQNYSIADANRPRQTLRFA